MAIETEDETQPKKPLYMIGEYGDCIAFAESCGLSGGEWYYIRDAQSLRSIPDEQDLLLVCTDDVYWDQSGYWTSDDFLDAIWDKDIYFQRIRLTEA